MAITKKGFYLQGEWSARMYAARSPGNEYSMPVFGCGKSWQARAFASGFEVEVARIKAKKMSNLVK